MRKLIALVFHYSLNGLLADEGTDYYRFCFELLDEAGGASDDDESLDFLQGAHAHVMGRTAYEGMSTSLPAHPDHPWAGILTAGRKVVFSRTLETADWANTTIASGDTRRRSTSSGRAATVTSSSGAASPSGGRSCSST